MNFWLFNCKKVSHLVSEAMDRDISPARRIGIKFHLMMCRYCWRYERQLKTIRQLVRKSAEDKISPTHTLSDEKKRHLKNIIKQHTQRDQSP